jgi:peptide/nickel transport system permease protein
VDSQAPIRREGEAIQVLVRYVARRLLSFVPTLLCASAASFYALRVLPGDVAQEILGGPGGTGVVLPYSLAALRRVLGLNQPLYQQYLTWLGSALHGDFGRSLYTATPVSSEIVSALPVTVELAVLAVLISIILGIPLGVLAATRRNTLADHSINAANAVLLAVPPFCLGLVILLLATKWAHWSPALVTYSIWNQPVANLGEFLPPAAVLAGAGLALTARVVRSTLLEVLPEDHVRTARAYGLSEFTVINRYALRSSLAPLITLTAITFVQMLGGAVVIEEVFALPGLGSLFVTSVTRRDYPVVQALVLLSVTTVLVINLLVDVINAALDRRVLVAVSANSRQRSRAR